MLGGAGGTSQRRAAERCPASAARGPRGAAAYDRDGVAGRGGLGQRAGGVVAAGRRPGRPRRCRRRVTVSVVGDGPGRVHRFPGQRGRGASGPHGGAGGAHVGGGVPIPEEFGRGWAGAAPVTRRTLQRAFAGGVDAGRGRRRPGGDRARRAKLVYLRRRASHRNPVWGGDHKNLPILVLPPRGAATQPWVTMFVDDATSLITGWAIAVTPHAGTVLTALRMGMLPDDAGPSCGVPGMLRLDRGREFAADSVKAAAAALGVEVHVLPAYQANGKGKIERVNRTVDQILLMMLPGFTEGP